MTWYIQIFFSSEWSLMIQWITLSITSTTVPNEIAFLSCFTELWKWPFESVFHKSLLKMSALKIIIASRGLLGSFIGTALPIQPILPNFLLNGPNWLCCIAGSSKTAPRILFSIVLGAKYSFYVKSNTKGQIISKNFFCFFNSSKNERKFLS